MYVTGSINTLNFDGVQITYIHFVQKMSNPISIFFIHYIYLFTVFPPLHLLWLVFLLTFDN